MEPFNQPTTRTEVGKPAAIVAYLGFIGLIIAFVLNQNEKAPLASYHIRQSLGLMIVLFICYIALMVIGFIPGVRYITLVLFPLVGIGGLVLLIMGIIAAVNGEMKPLPIVGNEIQNRLGSVG